MSIPSIDDYAWLTSVDSEPYFTSAIDHGGSLTSLAKSLRKQLGPQRAHLILEQLDLRERARLKFAAAERMFFTRQALEQATNEDIARYVASRFPDGAAVADLCCGVGGNLLALGNRGPATGVERDPIVACLARANARLAARPTVHVLVADAGDFSLAGHAAFYIDPDRRAHGRRTVDLRFYQPDLAALERMIETCPHAAIKLAPATAVPDHWRRRAELEWIGHGRECKQQIAWFGGLARRPGIRVATICGKNGQLTSTTLEDPRADPPQETGLRRFVHIAHPSLVAARLVPSIAAKHAFAQVAGTSDLLTGERFAADGGLASFETVVTCPAHLRTIRSLLVEFDIAPTVVRVIGRRDATRSMAEKLRRDRGQQGGVFCWPSQPRGQAAITLRRQQDSASQ